MKKSKGKKFLEKFIDLREIDEHVFCNEVLTYLRTEHPKVHVHKSTWNLDKDFTLGSQFFGFGHFIVLDVGDTAGETIILGKGVCYDTGGYNLKTNMEGMYYDRNGALLAIAATLDTGVPSRVFFTSNVIRPDSPVHGQIMKQGKVKVVISNTDAEGRIGLASLLHSVRKTHKNVLTIATLTGAAVQVTGNRTYALVHSNEKSDYTSFMQLALDGYDLWPAPFHKEYDVAVKSKINGADVDSCPKFAGAGSSTAFSFLKTFAKDKHYMHLDIAAMMTTSDGNGLVWGLEEVEALLGILK